MSTTRSLRISPFNAMINRDDLVHRHVRRSPRRFESYSVLWIIRMNAKSPSVYMNDYHVCPLSRAGNIQAEAHKPMQQAKTASPSSKIC